LRFLFLSVRLFDPYSHPFLFDPFRKTWKTSALSSMLSFRDQDNAHLLRTIGQSQTDLLLLTHITVVDILGLRYMSTLLLYLESPVTELITWVDRTGASLAGHRGNNDNCLHSGTTPARNTVVLDAKFVFVLLCISLFQYITHVRANRCAPTRPEF
jgi:hypothetical protein